mgnify:CR=1 FL=1
MERIKKALERAGQDRLAATDVLRQTSQHQGIPADLSTGVRYTMTKMVEVSPKTLLDNRIIAALGLGLLVVEAAQRSGSLISARLANELGRVVFAVPGSPLDPRCEGTNNLIKNGATLVTGARDILDALTPMTSLNQIARPVADEPVRDDLGRTETSDSDRRRIVDALGPTPVHVDELIAFTGATPAQVWLVLLELDIAGRLQRHSGGAVSILYG